MKVFKFGGASVSSADGVRNVAKIVAEYGKPPIVVVISAMGKTTNALEDILNAYWNGGDYVSKIKSLKEHHLAIMDGLFVNRSAGVYDEIENFFLSLELYFDKPLERNYDFIYDQVVSYGEIISTKIVSCFLSQEGISNKWIDARNFIVTDKLYRQARVDWKTTNSLISRKIPEMAARAIVITQGFIGGTKDSTTTTLGREGSDYTASIFAHALNAEEVVIWKDVPGVLNADPRKIRDTVKFDELSYQEAIEMTYYGATVLHPKTIKPIQNKNIPLNVRSFIHPEAKGTIIRSDIPVDNTIPIIISKEKQVLLSLSTKDFSFIAEESIEKIFDEVVDYGIKVNIMNNSAISFRICVDDTGQKVDTFIQCLSEEFDIERQNDLELITVKHFQPHVADTILAGRKIILEQHSGTTVQYVVS